MFTNRGEQVRKENTNFRFIVSFMPETCWVCTLQTTCKKNVMKNAGTQISMSARIIPKVSFTKVLR